MGDSLERGIWAISDLHLSIGLTEAHAKPMDIFGDKWIDHKEIIYENWIKNIEKQDIVLIPGDICWANKIEEAMPTLNWLDSLPGKKVILRGNHDNWWHSISKIKSILPESIYMIHNDSVTIDDLAFCGARGWSIYSGDMKSNQKLIKREAMRLENSLKQLPDSCRKKIALMHFPPFLSLGEKNVFLDLLIKYKINICVFGHLHGTDASKFKNCCINNIIFYLVSADYLDFCPIKIYNI